MLFANCGALPAGIALMPDASLDDGTMDIAVIQPTGPLGWLGIWRKVWWDNSVLRRSRAGRRVLERRGRNSSIRYLRGRTADTAMVSPTSIELDGDELGTAVRMSCGSSRAASASCCRRGTTSRTSEPAAQPMTGTSASRWSPLSVRVKGPSPSRPWGSWITVTRGAMSMVHTRSIVAKETEI